MSESQRVEGNRVYCHACYHEWDRSQGGLQCPACESEFAEIIGPDERSQSNAAPPIPHYSRPTESPQLPQPSQSPQSPNPFHDHNPWASEPNNNGFTTFEFNTPGGRGTFSVASRTYTFGVGSMGTRDMAADEISRNFETMLGNIMGYNQRRPTMMTGHIFEFPSHRNDRGFASNRPGPPTDLFSMLIQGVGPRSPSQQGHPLLELFGPMFNSANARRGDAVFTQEAFDRVMTQLMEQNSTNAPGPASEAAISALRTKRVDEDMMGSDGTAECSICMDSLKLGDEVTVLPCNHWFHGDCVISWLREHDTCPHCRQPTTNSNNNPTSPSTSRRRRTSRRSSSVASPLSPGMDVPNRGTVSFQDSPSGLREARQQYYGRSRTPEPDSDRPSHHRRASDRSNRSGENSGGSGGGVTGWIRSRLPFSGP